MLSVPSVLPLTLLLSIINASLQESLFRSLFAPVTCSDAVLSAFPKPPVKLVGSPFRFWAAWGNNYSTTNRKAQLLFFNVSVTFRNRKCYCLTPCTWVWLLQPWAQSQGALICPAICSLVYFTSPGQGGPCWCLLWAMLAAGSGVTLWPDLTACNFCALFWYISSTSDYTVEWKPIHIFA